MIFGCDGAELGRGRTSVIITKSEKASGACRYAVHIVGFHDGLSRRVNYVNVGRDHVLDTHDVVNRSTVFEWYCTMYLYNPTLLMPGNLDVQAIFSSHVQL